MLNNDISNRKAPSILVRVDNFLVVPVEDTLKDRLLNKIIGKEKRADLDEDVTRTILRAFTHTDYYVGVVCLKSEWNKYAKHMKRTIEHYLPVGNVHLVDSPLDIAKMLQREEYMYYVDNNEDQLVQVGHNNCINLEGFRNIVRGGYNFA